MQERTWVCPSCKEKNEPLAEACKNCSEIKPLETFDYLGGLFAVANLLIVGLICLMVLIFALAGGTSQSATIALFALLLSIIATVSLFVRFLRKRRYFNATVISWFPMVIFFVISLMD